jgi:MFS family permease
MADARTLSPSTLASGAVALAAACLVSALPAALGPTMAAHDWVHPFAWSLFVLAFGALGALLGADRARRALLGQRARTSALVWLVFTFGTASLSGLAATVSMPGVAGNMAALAELVDLCFGFGVAIGMMGFTALVGAFVVLGAGAAATHVAAVPELARRRALAIVAPTIVLASAAGALGGALLWPIVAAVCVAIAAWPQRVVTAVAATTAIALGCVVAADLTHDLERSARSDTPWCNDQYPPADSGFVPLATAIAAVPGVAQFNVWNEPSTAIEHVYVLGPDHSTPPPEVLEAVRRAIESQPCHEEDAEQSRPVADVHVAVPFPIDLTVIATCLDATTPHPEIEAAVRTAFNAATIIEIPEVEFANGPCVEPPTSVPGCSLAYEADGAPLEDHLFDRFDTPMREGQYLTLRSVTVRRIQMPIDAGAPPTP